MQEICNVKISLLQPAVMTGHIIFLIQTVIVKKGWKTPNKQYYYLSVSTRAVIGQFGGPDSPVVGFAGKLFRDFIAKCS